MRLLTSLYILLLVAGGACMEAKSDPIHIFLPGTYVRFSQHEFGRENDTLIIKPTGDLFRSERRWRYDRMLDGRQLETDYKLTAMTGTLTNGMLIEDQTGIQYAIDCEEGVLSAGQARYTKQ